MVLNQPGYHPAWLQDKTHSDQKIFEMLFFDGVIQIGLTSQQWGLLL
jgi:hypothetical protein